MSIAVERRLPQRAPARAVDPNRRRRAGHEEQIAAAACSQQPKPPLEARQISHTGRQRRIGGMQLENQPVDIVVVGHHVLTGDPRTWTAFYPNGRKTEGTEFFLFLAGLRATAAWEET